MFKTAFFCSLFILSNQSGLYAAKTINAKIKKIPKVSFLIVKEKVIDNAGQHIHRLKVRLKGKTGVTQTNINDIYQLNAEVPNLKKDYCKFVDSLSISLIAHEIGQYFVFFPDLQEIKKYTGILEPLNFKAILCDLKKKKLLTLAGSFKLSSGKFALNLYKEEIERALKTNNISGFQLLDLHDFPDQGTALIGLLNAFWKSKELVKPENFREFCSPVVPLLHFEKTSYLNNEKFNSITQISYFSDKKLDATINYEITTKKGLIVFSGSLPKKEIDLGSSNTGEINLDLNKINKPEALNKKVNIPHTVYQKNWTIWVYPAKQETVNNKALLIMSKDVAFKALWQGKTMVLNPDTSQIIGLDGRFTCVFWSPVHFPDQHGTNSLLPNQEHPAFAAFPTEFYSTWQWWDLVTRSKIMVIDSLPEVSNPIVRVIDNFFKNRKMVNVIVAKVGNGKFILCSMDITHDLETRIEARQLKYSLMDYAGSEKLNPQNSIT